MPAKNKRKQDPAEDAGGAANAPGRLAQRNRTRKAIVGAAMRLMAAGRSPSASEVAEEAQVSRRTIYLYFPAFEQLLLDATVGQLSAEIVAPALAPGSRDAAARAEE